MCECNVSLEMNTETVNVKLHDMPLSDLCEGVRKLANDMESGRSLGPLFNALGVLTLMELVRRIEID